MNKMKFKLFLEQTISDFLSSIGDEVKAIKLQLRSFLQNKIAGRDLDTAINLFTYIYHNEGMGDISKDWETFRDYLTANLSINRTLFVNSITRKELEDLNDKYHLNLKIKDKSLRKGPKGEDLVDVSKELTELSKVLKLPNNFKPSLWSGWKWTSLGCRSSGEEGAAAGHCGNAGGNAGDNIFSLRNSNQQVLLTFIVNVNTGALGESKALNNEKPKKELHPAIAALLSSKYIKKIEGGGYLEEANFSLEDFKYNEQLYNYFSEHLKGDKTHQKPENYLPLSFLTSLSDELIHVRYPTPDQKAKLLGDILNVFSNYKVFDVPDEEGVKFKPIPINFDLNKLIKEALKSSESQKVKYLLDIYDKVVSIYAENKIWGGYSLQKYRPDLAVEDIPTNNDGDFTVDIKKIEKVNVGKDTVEDLLKVILSKKLNLRDKSNLMKRTMSAAGHGYRKNKTDSESAAEVDRQSSQNSKFTPIINNLMHEIILSCLSADKIPKYLEHDVVDYLEDSIDDSLLHDIFEIKFNSKKQTFDFIAYSSRIRYSINGDEDKNSKLVLNQLENDFPKFKYEFIKKGMPVNRPVVKDVLFNCSLTKFQAECYLKIKQVLKTNYGFYVKDDSEPHFRNQEFATFTKRKNAKELLKNALENKPITIAKEIYDDINKCKSSVFNKMLKNISSFILEKFDEISQCIRSSMANNKILWDSKTGKHNKKVKYEDPTQLKKQRLKTQSYLQRLDYERAVKEYEEEKKQRIKRQAEELTNRTRTERQPTQEHTIYFKEWLSESYREK